MQSIWLVIGIHPSLVIDDQTRIRDIVIRVIFCIPDSNMVLVVHFGMAIYMFWFVQFPKNVEVHKELSVNEKLFEEKLKGKVDKSYQVQHQRYYYLN